MADDNKPTLTLLDQQQALTAYLEALFRERPVLPHEEISTPPQVSIGHAVGGNSLPLGGRVITDVDRVERGTSSESPSPTNAPAIVDANEIAATQAVAVPAAPFQVLFFTLSGLRLAVPLDRLDGIVKWVDPTPIPKMPVWHLGLVKYQGVTVSVVDASHFISVPIHLRKQQGQYKFIVLIGGKRWGIGADAISNVVTLTPEQVKWHNRSDSTKAWLAGTVKEQMCALIEVDGLIAQLEARG